MRIFFLILFFSQFLFSENISENFCRGKFEITLFYKKPATERELYEAKVLREKVAIFSNFLEVETSNIGLKRMLYIDVMPEAKISFDPVRMKAVLPYKDGFFDINRNLIKVLQFLGLSKPKSIHLEDFFGSPVEFKDGFLFQLYKDSNFLLTYNNKKRYLILKDPRFFSGVKSFSDRFIFYKTANSLWFIDTKLRRNEMNLLQIIFATAEKTFSQWFPKIPQTFTQVPYTRNLKRFFQKFRMLWRKLPEQREV